MAVELLSACTNTQLSASMDQDSAVREAATGLHTLKNLITLLSHSHPSNLDSDCQAVANSAVSHFKKAISLLGRSPRTGHARFRRAPLDSSKIYNATPIQQIPPPVERLESATTINFSYSSAPNGSFLTSIPGADSGISLQHEPSSSSFQITDLSRASSGVKRKCGSENLGSGKCSVSSGGRCHCSKKRYLKIFLVLISFEFLTIWALIFCGNGYDIVLFEPKQSGFAFGLTNLDHSLN